MISEFDIKCLEKAIEIANCNIDFGGGPFGAVISENNLIISESGNKVRIINDPTAHAEIEAIRIACKTKGSFTLENCTIYSSCEPCPMCLGAIYWAKISRIVFASTRVDAAKAGFDDNTIYEEIQLPVGDRKIETIHLQNAKADSVFKKWIEIDKKLEY